MNSLHVSRDAGLFAHCVGCHNVFCPRGFSLYGAGLVFGGIFLFLLLT